MASNGNYNVNLNLVDGEAAAKLRKINQEMAKAQAPLKAYQRELKRFNDLSGRTAQIEKYNQALGNTRNRLTSIGQGVSSIAKPLAAVFGIGSVAGVVGLTRAFASWGNEIRNTSALLGITNQKAIALKQSGKLAGIGDQVQGLKSFQDTQNNAAAGQDASAQYADRLLGINPKMDFQKAELQSVNRINQLLKEHRINLAAARRLLGAAGEDESLAGQDPKRLQRSFNIANQNAKEMAPYAKAAADWRDKLAEAGGRIDVIKTKLSAALMPALGPIIQKFIDWTKDNKAVDDSIGKIANGAKELGEWLQGVDFTKVTSGIQFVANHWKAFLAGFVILKGFSMTAAALSVVSDLTTITKGLFGVTAAAKEARLAILATEGVAGLGAASLVTGGIAVAGAAAGYAGYKFYSTYKHDHSDAGRLENRQKAMKYQTNFTALQQNEKQRQLMQYLMSKEGLSAPAAASLTAQARQESGFNPQRIGDNGAAYGLFQWHGDRQAAIEKQFGKSLSGMSMEEQAKAAVWELRTSERKAGNELFNAKNIDQATKAGLDYERPKEYLQNGVNGQEFLNRRNLSVSALSANSDLAIQPKQELHIHTTLEDNRTVTTVKKNTTPYNPNISAVKSVSKGGKNVG